MTRRLKLLKLVELYQKIAYLQTKFRFLEKLIINAKSNTKCIYY